MIVDCYDTLPLPRGIINEEFENLPSATSFMSDLASDMLVKHNHGGQSTLDLVEFEGLLGSLGVSDVVVRYSCI